MQTENTAQHSERPNATFGDAAFGDAARDAMWRGHGGFEIALSPVIVGLMGYGLDGWLGTRPVLMIIGALLGFIGAVANQYYQYKARMEVVTAEREARANA